MEKQNKKATYTKDQVRELVADVLADVTIKLKDPSLVIASKLAMALLEKEFNK